MRTSSSLGLFPALTFLLVTLALGVNCTNPKRTKEQELLKQILDENKYDRKIRAYGEADNDPTTVNVNMYVRSIERVDDVKMQFSIQLTFRMEWLDRRLNFESSLQSLSGYNMSYLTLDGSSSAKIWEPDLFFANDKQGQIHEMLMPNKYIRIFPDGRVLSSQRISLTLSCPMIFKNFPFDKQTCSVRMASYGWTSEDLIFKWKANNPVQITPVLNLPVFTLSDFTTNYCDSHTNTGTYSCIRLDLLFGRVGSYYLVQIYIPTCMMVIVAWLSLWLDHRDGTARVTLSALTLLVTAVMIAMFKDSFPRVSYTKAIDVWTGIIMTFLFSVLVEFVLVNWLARRDKRAEKTGLMNSDDDDGGRKKMAVGECFKGLPMSDKLDYVWRIAYPCLFLFFIIVYWASY